MAAKLGTFSRGMLILGNWGEKKTQPRELAFHRFNLAATLRGVGLICSSFLHLFNGLASARMFRTIQMDQRYLMPPKNLMIQGSDTDRSLLPDK